MAALESPAGSAVVRKKRSVAPVIITLLIAAIGVGVIATSTTGGAGAYNYSVAELQRRHAALVGKDVKVAGRIAVKSVRGEPASASFRFDLEDDEGHKIAVAYPRLLPDPFEEGRDAIVSGTMRDGVLWATNLTVKCPSRYTDTASMQAMSDADRARYYATEYKNHVDAKAASPRSATPKKLR